MKRLTLSILLLIISFINSIKIDFSKSTIMERACNWETLDLSYFNMGSYSDNGILIMNMLEIGDIANSPNLQPTTTIGKINVNVYENSKGNKIKKTMDCKYIVMIGAEMLFCDILNGNKIYYGIQLLNDGEIKFSNNYNQNIFTCKSNGNNPIPQNDEYTDTKNNEKTDVLTNQNNNDNENKNDENKSSERSEDIANNSNDNNQNINIENNYDNKEKKYETKKTNLLNISQGAAIGIGSGCFASAAAMATALILKAISQAKLANNNIVSGEINDLTKLGINNKKKSPKIIITYTVLIFGTVIMIILGIIIIIPKIRSVKKEKPSVTWVYNEDAYQQHSKLPGKHAHWMGDKLGRPEYGNPDETYEDKDGNIKHKKCWFCEKGCAISSYLHMMGLEPNEENIKKYLNNDANMDWDGAGFRYANGASPHDDCFGKIEKEYINSKGEKVKSVHFVHIKKIYDDGSCDVFDPNGGNKRMKLTDFNDFIIRK